MGSRKKAPAGVENTAGQKAMKDPARKTTIAAKATHPIVREVAPVATAIVSRAPERPAAKGKIGAEGAGEPFRDAVVTMHKSLTVAGLGVLAVNRKLLEMMRQNVGSSLELARDMAQAESPLQSVKLQMDFWRERMGGFAAQARELRELSAGILSGASK
jgi:hypothetical protein